MFFSAQKDPLASAFAVCWADGARKGVKNFYRAVIRMAQLYRAVCADSEIQGKKARLFVNDRQKKGSNRRIASFLCFAWSG
ncbi:MAG: hypothetical protein K6E31_08740 [bacterium]|nr:hypothetical protein [bacterium]